MSSRCPIQEIMVIIAMCAVISGCSRPIVKPDTPLPGPVPGGFHSQGQVNEQEIQAVQATLKPVYFNYDQFTLSPEAQEALQYNAEILKRAPHLAVVAEGHCDERGTAEYNLALGDRRARAAVEYLAGLAVQPQRLSTVSYGSELPLDPSHNEAAWGKNRRVYLRVSR